MSSTTKPNNFEKDMKKIFRCRKCNVELIKNQNIGPLMYEKVVEGHHWEQYCHTCDQIVARSFKIAEQQKYLKRLAEGRIKQFNEWAKDIPTDKPRIVKKSVFYNPDVELPIENNNSLKEYTCGNCKEVKYSKNPPVDDLCPKCTEKEISCLRKLKREIKNALIYPVPPEELVQFLKLSYSFKYDNYQELISKEFERQFSRIEAYDESVVKKYYDHVGHLGNRIRAKCEECNRIFSYIYIGGPKRHSCPKCVDWSKKFPLESSSTYWIINTEKS